MNSVIIQKSCFDESENVKFCAALQQFDIPYQLLDDVQLLSAFNEVPDAYFRGSCEVLSQCPFPSAAHATPMYVFNVLHWQRYTQGVKQVNEFSKPFFSGELSSDKFGYTDFIKSAAGDKRLTGDVFHHPYSNHSYHGEWDEYDKLPKYTICVKAPEQELQNEIRFVVFRGEVITGSEYVDSNGRVVQRYTETTPEQKHDAVTILLFSQLSRIEALRKQPYTLDIAYINGKAYLIEINSFWSAGLYGCDIEKVIKNLVNMITLADSCGLINNAILVSFRNKIENLYDSRCAYFLFVMQKILSDFFELLCNAEYRPITSYTAD